MITVFMLVFVAMISGEASVLQHPYPTKAECVEAAAEVTKFLEEINELPALVYLGCVPVKVGGESI